MTKYGAAATSFPKCHYFDQMKFLAEETPIRPTVTNLPAQVCPVNEDLLSDDSSIRKRKSDVLSVPSSSGHGYQTCQDYFDNAILKRLENRNDLIVKSMEKIVKRMKSHIFVRAWDCLLHHYR